MSVMVAGARTRAVAAEVIDAVVTGGRSLDAAIAAGDRETVLKIFCEEVVQMRASDIAALKASPAWPARLATAKRSPVDIRDRKRRCGRYGLSGLRSI